MPSKTDKIFIENLQNFTNSLDDIVTILKEQSKKGEAINQMLATIDGPKLSDISEDMKKIIEVNKSIDNRTKEILEEVKEARKAKEGGQFEKISSKENKKKIVESVAVISLIAGGVLAIGMAFKIVGKVDFLSVVALSMSILAISYAFSKIAENEKLTWGKVLMAGFAVITMAGSITAASYFLQNFKEIKGSVLLSMVLVSASIGVATYFLIKAMDNVKVKGPGDIAKFLVLPLIVPLIAYSIVKASSILNETKEVSWQAGISAIFVGVILAVASYSVMLLLKGTKDASVEQMLIAGLMGTIIAASLVASSLILQEFLPVKDPWSLIIGGLVIGLAILAVVPAVIFLSKYGGSLKNLSKGVLGVVMISAAITISSWILSLGKYDFEPPGFLWSLQTGLAIIVFTLPIFIINKMGIGIKDFIMGSLGVIIISTAIMVSSWILSIGNYGNYPDWKWALGVGLSIILFLPAVLILGFVAITGIGIGVIALGSLMTLMVAASIMASSHILNEGNYDKFPSARWAAGVGLSMILFVPAILILGFLAITGIGALAIILGAKMVLKVSEAIVAVSHVLNEGNYDKFPSVKWAAGVGLSIMLFIPMLLVLGILSIVPFIGRALRRGTSMAVNISESIVAVSHILNKGNYDKFPSVKWIMGTSATLFLFSTLLRNFNKIGIESSNLNTIKLLAEYVVEVDKILGKSSFKNVISDNWVNGLQNLFLAVRRAPHWWQLERFKYFTKVLENFADTASKLNSSGIDKLYKLTTSITVMSVIDQGKLQDTINVLKKNKDEIGNIIEKGLTVTSGEKQTTISVEQPSLDFLNENDKQDVMIRKFDQIIQKFDVVLNHLTSTGKPEETGKRDS